MYLVRATEFTLFSARAPVSSALLQIWALAVLVVSVLLTCLGGTLFTVFGSDLRCLNSEVDGALSFPDQANAETKKSELLFSSTILSR